MSKHCIELFQNVALAERPLAVTLGGEKFSNPVKVYTRVNNHQLFCVSDYETSLAKMEFPKEFHLTDFQSCLELVKEINHKGNVYGFTVWFENSQYICFALKCFDKSAEEIAKRICEYFS